MIKMFRCRGCSSLWKHKHRSENRFQILEVVCLMWDSKTTFSEVSRCIIRLWMIWSNSLTQYILHLLQRLPRSFICKIKRPATSGRNQPGDSWPPGVAVSFLPQIIIIKNPFLYFQIQSFFFPPTPLGRNSPNSKAALQTGSEHPLKLSTGSSLGLPSTGRRGGGGGGGRKERRGESGSARTLREYMFGPAVQLMLILQLHSEADSAHWLICNFLIDWNLLPFVPTAWNF